MKHIKKIKIDIDKKNFEAIPSVQYDSNTRFLHINLLNGSVPFNLSGCSVKISGTKPDGTAIFNNCTIINAKEGFIEVELTEQMNAAPGTLKCELKLYSGSGVLTTKHFDIDVTASVTSKSVTSGNEFKALEEALSKVNNIDTKFESLTEATVKAATEKEIQKQIALGNMANLAIPNGSITKEKLDPDIKFGVEDGTLTLEKFKKELITDNVSLLITSGGVNTTYVVMSLDIKKLGLNAANNAINISFLASIDSFIEGNEVGIFGLSQYDSMDYANGGLEYKVKADERFSESKLYRSFNISGTTNSNGRYLNLCLRIVSAKMKIEYLNISINGVDYSSENFDLSKVYGSHITSTITKLDTVVNDKIAFINDSLISKTKTYSSAKIEQKINAFGLKEDSVLMKHIYYGEYTTLQSYHLTNSKLTRSIPMFGVNLTRLNLNISNAPFRIRFKIRTEQYENNTHISVFGVSHTHNMDVSSSVPHTKKVTGDLKENLYMLFEVTGHLVDLKNSPNASHLTIGLDITATDLYIEDVSFEVNNVECGLSVEDVRFYVHSANIEKLDINKKERLASYDDIIKTSLNFMTGTNIACFGDSITDEEQYTVQLRSLLRANVANMGSSGGDHRRMWQIVQGKFAGKPNLDYTKYELVTIMIGTNFGPMELEDISEFDTLRAQEGGYLNYPETYCGCICKTIEYLMEKNPALRIMLLTSPKTTERPLAQLKAIVENMKQIGERYAIPVIDVQNNCQVSKYNYAITMPDKVHPRGQGAKNIGRYVAKQILANW